MSSKLTALALFGVLVLAAPGIYSQEYFVPVSVGSSREFVPDALMWRIQTLEEAVRELQSRIRYLEAAPPASSFTTCFIDTPFDGTIYATEPTATAAQAKALDRCYRKTNNSVFCDVKKLKCGQ